MTKHPHTTNVPCPRIASRVLASLMCVGVPLASIVQTGKASYVELSRSTTVDTTGREIIAIRVRPTASMQTAVTSAPLPIMVREPAPAGTHDARRLDTKKHDSFSVTAHVRATAGLPVVSELRWRAANKDWLAYSNVDFRHLTQLGMIETDDTVYFWFPFVYTVDANFFTPPAGLTFAGPEAEYVVYAARAEWQATPEAFAALDELHALYERCRTELSAAHAAREAEAARVVSLPPAPPKPVVIRYHVPVLPPPGYADTRQGGAR